MLPQYVFENYSVLALKFNNVPSFSALFFKTCVLNIFPNNANGKRGALMTHNALFDGKQFEILTDDEVTFRKILDGQSQ